MMIVAIVIGAFVLGCALVVAGVYVLAGLGWALIAAAMPCLVVATLILRGSHGD
jgi:hypothetical protein